MNGPSTAHGHTALIMAGVLYELLRQLRAPRIDAFLLDWPQTLHATREVTPSLIPAARWLADLRDGAPEFAAPFVALLADASASLPWRRSYGAAQAGAEFMDKYGYCEIVGSLAAVQSTRLAVGVLVLGPHADYAAHWHEAEEIYVPLVGSAHWWQGIRPWRLEQPGTLIHHARFEPHAMRTGPSPLLALYLWRSKHLAQKSQLISGTRR